MKKVLLTISIVAMVLVLTLSVVACKNEPEKVTLTLCDNDGTTVLATQEVEVGKAPVVPAEPTKEGYVFKGWFVTPTSTKAFDFTVPLKEDAKAYAQWSLKDFQDARDWVISGTVNGWGADLSEKYHLVKTAGKGNEFTITIDFAEEDEFQLTVLLEDGTLAYSTEGARAADKHLVDASEYMEGKGGLGTYKNICVKVAGNYTLTLTSDPETDNNRLTVVRNGDATPVEEVEVVNYYIKGAKITKWANAYTPATRFDMVQGALTLVVYLDAGDEFMFYGTKTVGSSTTENSVYLNAQHLDANSKALFDGAGNMKTKEAGIYTFVIDVEEKTISATMAAKSEEEHVYFIDGGILGGNWGAYQNAEASANYKLEKDGAVYTIKGVTLNAGEELVIRMHKATDEAELTWGNVVKAYNADYLFGTVGFERASKDNANIKVVETGVYNITIDEYCQFVTIAKEGKDVYVKGTMNGWKHEFADEYKMIAGANVGEYEITLAFEANAEFGLEAYSIGSQANGEWVGKDKLGTDGDANKIFVVAGKGNLTCSVAGTYKVVYNYKTGVINIYNVVA